MLIGAAVELPKAKEILFQDAFWESAYDVTDPFRDDFLRDFRPAVISGDGAGLAWGKMAIYGITDTALWPLLYRFLELACFFPRADLFGERVEPCSYQSVDREYSAG
jgi:hypothetical protein